MNAENVVDLFASPGAAPADGVLQDILFTAQDLQHSRARANANFHRVTSEAWGRLRGLDAKTGTFNLFGAQSVVGRRETCDVVVSHASISGYHCRIRKGAPENTTIEDLSSNGTWLNGMRLAKRSGHELHHGDVIHLLRPRQQQQVPSYVFEDFRLFPEEEGPVNRNRPTGPGPRG